MKESFYFPHDTNAHNDPKLMSVFMEVGATGIGIYWMMIEVMHQEDSGMLTIDQYNNFIKWWSSRESKGNSLVEQLLNTYFTNKLFVKTDDGFVYSNRVLDNKKYRENISNRRSLAGKKSAEARANLTSAEQKGTNDEQGKERKGKERKEKKNTNTDSFLSFWNLYPRKIGKPAALKKYREKEKDDIEKGLALWCDYWIAAETEQQFIPHPATWLNQERWKDIPPEVEGVSSFDLDGAQK